VNFVMAHHMLGILASILVELHTSKSYSEFCCNYISRMTIGLDVDKEWRIYKCFDRRGCGLFLKYYLHICLERVNMIREKYQS
jgi:hypothetical protein